MADLSKLSREDLQLIADKKFDQISPEARATLNVEVAVGEPSTFDKFAYAFESADTDIGNALTYLSSEFPIGKVGFSFSEGFTYTPPEELYGKQYMNASPDVRRQVIARAKDIELENKYPEAARQAGMGGAAGIAGTILGSLISPTTLIPISKAYQGYKGLAAVGAAFGAEYNVLEQLAKKGEVDVGELAGATAIGAIAAPATSAVIKGLTPSARKALIERRSPEAKLKAQEDFDQIQNIVYEEVAKGGQTPGSVKQIVMNRMGLDEDALDDILIKSDAKVRVPSVEEAQAVIAAKVKSIAPSAATSGWKFGEDILGVISTNIKNISPKIHDELAKTEFAIAKETEEYIKIAQPLTEIFDKMKGQDLKIVSRNLYNGDFDNALTVMKRYSVDSDSAFESTRELLKTIHTRMKDEAGYTDIGEIENYFPRLVKSYDDFLKSINKEQQTKLQRALKVKAKELGLKSAKDVPEEDRINIINQIMRGRNPIVADNRLGFTKGRAVAQIDDKLIEQYQDPKTALNSYIMKAVSDIHKRKFLGRGSNVTDEGVRRVNLDKSVGSYVEEAIKRGELAEADSDRLADLVSARFGLGEQSAGQVSGTLRNIGYMTTLGNPFSALTQIGDLGMSVYMNGMKNTIAGMLGKKTITLEDIGINNIVAQELATVGKTAKLLDKTLGAVGFKALDRLGKTTFINSAYKRFANLAKSDKGIAEIRKKYGGMLGEEFKSTITDLRAGNVTDNVKLMLYNELAGVQPINLSQVPLAYLNNPNGRIFYSLKTFAIKQLDVMRRDIVQEFKSGNQKKAAENLVAYMTIIPMMGATVDETKDFLRGQGMSAEDMPDNYIENLFKVFGGSQYVMDKYVSKGQVGSALGETIAPPLDWINAIGEDVWKTMNGEFVGEESKALRELPVIGDVWYNFFGGGLEKAIQFEQKRRLD
jgi:hypothetical protein